MRPVPWQSKRWHGYAAFAALAALVVHGLHLAALLPATAVWVYDVIDLPHHAGSWLGAGLRWAGVAATAAAMSALAGSRAAHHMKGRVVVFRVAAPRKR